MTSKYVGVHWSKQKERWKVDVRKAGIQVLCDNEYAAAMIYNVVARSFWPGCRLNESFITEQNDFVTERFGRVFPVGEGKLAIVDQQETDETPWAYRRLVRLSAEWFLHRGIVCCAFYDFSEKKLKFRAMHEVILGTPGHHRNGDRLDNRLRNLRRAMPEPLQPLGKAELELSGPLDRSEEPKEEI